MAEPNFHLNKWNIHQLFLSCLLIAVKYQDDSYFDNKTFEMGGGVKTNNLMNFELEVFEKLNYNAIVSK